MTTPHPFAITGGKSHFDLAEEMCNKIKEVVYTYSDRVPLALAVGVIEIAKMEIMEEAK